LQDIQDVGFIIASFFLRSPLFENDPDNGRMAMRPYAIVIRLFRL
jgi:hypothetical protein